MDESSPSTSAAELVALLERNARDEAIDRLAAVRRADLDDRKATIRSVRNLVDDHPAAVGEVAPALEPFLADEDRSVRLSTAKVFVALAAATPRAVVPVVPTLADRLADDGEFYYVRARSAEALGYVALDHPEAVDDPEILADLRIGLSFAEPEVKPTLAKAIECVALGNPDRLRHQVASLAEHLDDDDELVRYHLCTALVAVASEHPARVTEVRDALDGRLTDDDPYVRGRAAEILGVLARSEATEEAPSIDDIEPCDGDAGRFLAERVRFARGGTTRRDHSDVGTIASIRRGTDEVVAAITSPDGDGACPNCGLALPEDGPAMCPRCGSPHGQ
jgi:HEAT repeat protein